MEIHQQLIKTIGLYFDAIYFCDDKLLSEVFHPQAHLFDAEQQEIFVDPLSSFLQDVASRPSPASIKQVRDDRILMIDWLSTKSVLVKVQLCSMDNLFVDHLNLLYQNNKWLIVAKIWHCQTTQPIVTDSPQI